MRCEEIITQLGEEVYSQRSLRMALDRLPPCLDLCPTGSQCIGQPKKKWKNNSFSLGTGTGPELWERSRRRRIWIS